MFSMTKAAATWSEPLRSDKLSPIKTEFDFYYLCLIIGIGLKQTPTLTNVAGTKEITRSLTTEFKQHKNLLLSLLISCEIKNSGSEITKESIKKIMDTIVDVENDNNISNNAADLMNRYAHAGFEHLREETDGKFTSAHTFFSAYYSHLPDVYSNWKN